MTSIRSHKSGGVNRRKPRGIGRAKRKRPEWGYLIMWEFRVRAGMEKRFERAYGSEGGWVKLFVQDESFIATELIHHLTNERSYVTLDWTSRKAYSEFRKRHFSKYKALDKKCEDFTESEREIGTFERVSNR